MKKAAAAALAVITLLGVFPVQAFAEEAAEPVIEAEESAEPVETEEPEETVILTDSFSTFEEVTPAAVSMTDEEAFAGYAASVFYPQEPQLSAAADASYLAGNALTGVDRTVYNGLAAHARQVAAGERSDTAAVIAAETGSCTAESLGLSTLGGSSLSEEAENALWALVDFDLSKVIDALLADMPYELYWYDKSVSTSVGMGGSYSCEYSGSEISAVSLAVEITVQMPVSADYAGEGAYTTDSARLATVRTAAANAAALVQTHSGETDPEKLASYRDAICEMTDYNDAAAENVDTPYGDPWQLIYVFDGDPSTTVVCEGYSKAFKYLCDISEFSSPLIYARLATGYMGMAGESGEDHMWNVLSMPDGRNYLVDVTNTDDGIGSGGSLFLNGYENVSADGLTYGFACAGDDYVYYTYDDDTLSTFSASDLTLSDADYSDQPEPVNVVASGTYGPNQTWVLTGEGNDLTLTVSGTGEMSGYYGGSPWMSYNARITTVVLEDGVTSVGDSALRGCTRLTSVTLPESVTSIENDAFRECSVLETITLPGALTYLGTCAFQDCTALTAITIPEGVTTFESWTFGYCSSLTTVVLPEGARNLGEYLFSGCANLSEITLPESLTEVGDGTFYDCVGLESIVIPEGVTKIGARAFNGCTGLTDITIPKTVTAIGTAAFKNCDSLETVYYTGAEAEWTAAGLQTNIPDGVRVICIDSVTPVESITLSSAEMTLEFGEQRQLTATVEPADATDPSVTWSSDDESVATVDASGLITAAGTGTAVITAASRGTPGVIAACTIHVTPKDLTGLASVEAIPDCTYNGTEQRPAVRVSFGTITLTEGRDFSVSYSNNTNAGAAAAVLMFCGNYTGTASAGFTIRKAVYDMSGVAFTGQSFSYDGTVKSLSVTGELPEGVSVSCIGNERTNAGVYTVIARFSGDNENYEPIPDMEARLVIERAENRWTTELTCDDAAFGLSPSPAAAAAFGTPVYSYSAEAAGTFTSEVPDEVGRYYVRAEVPDSENYEGLSAVTDFRIRFHDAVDASAFWYEPVYWAVDEGITTGWDDGTFRPWNTCNRAAVVTFLWRLAGSPEQDTSSAPFRDMTGNSDFDQAIVWAVNEKITTGYSDHTFRPWNTCNRAAIVTFLWRYMDKPPARAGYTVSFPDMTGNADFDSAITWAASYGITTGNSDGTFNPWGTCNRAAVVTFLWRMPYPDR